MVDSSRTAGSAASAADDAAPWLIVGLGNPGPDYDITRHNIGYDVVDYLAEQSGAQFTSQKNLADVAAFSFARPDSDSGEKILVKLMKSHDFMNLSGRAVKGIAQFYSIPLSHVIVIHDDLDLDPGVIKVKQGGGSGGHNGLKDITMKLNPDYIRVRVGIGRPTGRMDVSAYVLQKFSRDELAAKPEWIEIAADATMSTILHGVSYTQNSVHGR